MSKLDATTIDANAFAKGSIARLSFASGDYLDAIDELARVSKRDGETEAEALVRLHDEREPRLAALWKASQLADAFADPRPVPEQLAKRAAEQDAVLEHARKNAQPGESVEAALDRLARARDPELRRLYGQAVA